MEWVTETLDRADDHSATHRRVLMVAIGLSLVLHLLLIFLSRGSTHHMQDAKTSELEIEFIHPPAERLPEPEFSDNSAPKASIPKPSVTQNSPSLPDPRIGSLSPEPSETAAPESAVTHGDALQQDRAQRSDPELVQRLLAAPFEADPLPGPFDRPIMLQETPVEFQYPEREDLITMLSPALPELPFADPGWDVFMYAPGWQGDLHRGFDQITPEFGWRTNTGLEFRCRWVIVMVVCGWGRKR